MFRLVDGYKEAKGTSGRLEVLYNGVWGTITASSIFWGRKEAAVVCKMLGLPAEDPKPLK